jgi:hypothetical protein
LEVIEMSSARDVFKQHLKKEKQAQANSPSPQTVRDFVRICLPDIRKAIKKKTSWDIIAKAIQAVAEETYSVEIRVAPSTAKRAYYAITGKKAGRPRSTPMSSQKSNAPATAPTQVVAAAAPAVTPAPEPVARSPAVELEPEPESKPKPADEAFPSEEAPQPKEKYQEPAFNVPPGIEIPMA